MKFYYENSDFENTPNGGFRKIGAPSSLDWVYGWKNPILEINNYEPIIWNFSVTCELRVDVLNNNIEYFNNVFKTVKENPNVRLVFSSFQEGDHQYSFILKLIELKNKFSLNKEQITVITINKICLNYSHELNIIYKPFLLGYLSSDYSKVKDSPFLHNESKMGVCTTDEYLTEPKTNFFLCYSKNSTRDHRIKTILWLIKNDLIKDTLLSTLIKDEHRRFYNSTEDELNGLSNYFEDFLKMGYNVLDWDFTKDGNNEFSYLRYNTISHYSSTIFNIVLETTFEENSLNLTEKSFKPLANCQPFLIIGDPFANKTLLDFGFELYDDLIDYSFDEIKDNDKRLNAVFKEIKRIKNLGEKHLIDWYFKNKEKIEKNKTTLFTYSYNKMVDEVILELKELTQ